MTATRAARAPRTTLTRRRGLLLAAATATVLAAGATAPAVAAAPAAPGTPAVALGEGTLDWGVKESFRRYVTGPIAGGSATAADGAETNEDGTYRFTGGTGTYDTATHAVRAAFGGSVRFEGHHGALDLRLSGLEVITEGTSGSLVADVTVAGETTEDVAFASLDLTGVAPGRGEGGALVFAGIPAALTEGGAEAFEFSGNPMYPVGTELDPATLTVTPEAGRGEPGGEDPGGEEPGGENPGGEEPGGENPGGENPGGENPGGEEPGGEEPGGEDSGAEEPGGAVHDGTLVWGVKASFRAYVTGPVAAGRVELSDGAAEAGGGYLFPGGSGAWEAEVPSLEAAFEGGVRFTGHDGALDLAFTDLAVEIDGSGAALLADVSSRDRETGEVTAYEDLAVAGLDVPAGALAPENDVIELSAVPATLTAEGAEAFGGFYQEGEALDPVTVAVTVDEDAALPAPGGPAPQAGGPGGPAPDAGGTGARGGALATTGSSLPGPAATATTAALALAGAASLVAARRLRARHGR
ncbi:HtaA domain-containing protein [Streptomyces sp. DSM 44917]|uniref:HtaA domain-containing protein n=1 Tax=Streptomyces boetiae TaxID=3075541 RepID=A0ABU2L4S3_9ACTN|nr:HtaA domain-containing protein [Streptomyces sp. DSM 44917]MDT0306233.1 HtaA domain-containing protein [Streptomyces sp. DSM 44917]